MLDNALARLNEVIYNLTLSEGAENTLIFICARFNIDWYEDVSPEMQDFARVWSVLVMLVALDLLMLVPAILVTLINNGWLTFLFIVVLILANVPCLYYVTSNFLASSSKPVSEK